MQSVTKQEFVDPVASEFDEATTLGRILTRRFSCRAFRPDPVPHDKIEAFLKLAQLSASWCNSQAWQAIVTEGEGTDRFRKALLDAATTRDGAEPVTDLPRPARYRGRYLERRRETAWALYESVGIEHGDRVGSAQQTLENFRLFGAPHVMIITSDKDLGVYGAVDCGGYVATALLAAQSLGIDTIAQAAIAMQPDCVRRFFNIPDDRLIVCGISFGYADLDHPANAFRTKRDDLEEAVQWVTD
jgi:nitroreductase